MTNQTLSLNAKTRLEIGKKVSQIRTAGKIPAVLYGHKIKPQSLMVDYSAFQKAFTTGGESTLVDLTIDDQKPVKVLIQDYQLDPLTNQFVHVDFHQVRMDEKLHTEIELKFINESPAVKGLGGILVTNIHALAVTCLPQDLVHAIEVDLSALKSFSDVIHVSDIKVPAGITVLTPTHEVTVLVQPPRSEKEMADLESKPQAAAVTPEVVGEAKPEAEGQAEQK